MSVKLPRVPFSTFISSFTFQKVHAEKHQSSYCTRCFRPFSQRRFFEAWKALVSTGGVGCNQVHITEKSLLERKTSNIFFPFNFISILENKILVGSLIHQKLQRISWAFQIWSNGSSEAQEKCKVSVFIFSFLSNFFFLYLAVVLMHTYRNAKESILTTFHVTGLSLIELQSSIPYKYSTRNGI